MIPTSGRQSLNYSNISTMQIKLYLVFECLKQVVISILRQGLKYVWISAKGSLTPTNIRVHCTQEIS